MEGLQTESLSFHTEKEGSNVINLKHKKTQKSAKDTYVKYVSGYVFFQYFSFCTFLHFFLNIFYVCYYPVLLTFESPLFDK